MLLIVQISDYGHSSGYKVIPHCDFDSHFLRSNDEYFLVLIGHLYIFFWKMSTQTPFPTFKLGFFIVV